MATLAQRHAHLEAIALKLTTVCTTASSLSPNSAKMFEITDSHTDYSQWLPGSSGAVTTAAAGGTTLTTVGVGGSGGSATTTALSVTSGNPMAGKSFYAAHTTLLRSRALQYHPSRLREALLGWPRRLKWPRLVLSCGCECHCCLRATTNADINPSDTRAKVPSIATYAADVQKHNAAGPTWCSHWWFMICQTETALRLLPMVNSQLPTTVPLSTKTTSTPLLLKSTHIPVCNSFWSLVKSLRRIFIKSYTDLFLEPDSLANLLTNLNVAKCTNAESTYKTLVTYAMERLNLPNVAMYLDAGHVGWLG